LEQPDPERGGGPLLESRTVTTGNFVIAGTNLALNAQDHLVGGTSGHITMLQNGITRAEWLP